MMLLVMRMMMPMWPAMMMMAAHLARPLRRSRCQREERLRRGNVL